MRQPQRWDSPASYSALSSCMGESWSPELGTPFPGWYSDFFAVFIDCIYFSSFLFDLPDSQIFPSRKSEPTEIGQNWAHFIYLNLPRFYESYAFKKS